jgi:hypothetical protein
MTKFDTKAERDAYQRGRHEATQEAEAAAAKAPPDGEGEAKSLTIEDVKAMTPDQVNERWPEIQPLLEGQER